ALRTTVTIDDELLEKAHKYTGIKERSALLNEALSFLIAREAGRRLAALGGTEPDFVAPPRRRFPAE
ncbi:MAG: type II toxin-antitoxin system VapB family antitoxin, partial [Brevundimonas sp.]